MDENPWTDDDYTCPGESALRAFCEDEEEPESFGPAELAWFRPTWQACGVGL